LLKIYKKENQMKNKELLSTAIAYANGNPHIGHAFEFAYADTLVRFQKNQHKDIFFVTGMDEHGQKIQEKAKECGVSPHAFVDGYAEVFKNLDSAMSVAPDFFVRTSKEYHHKGAQYLWTKLAEKGDIVKRSYTALYCVGCEEFKTEKDLNEYGECPSHLKKPEEVEEENYFFTLSKYTDLLKEKITSGEMSIYPEVRKNEIMALLERGLDDVSFSRPKSKVSWGIPVPGDDSQVMYVWCDALSNYITAIGYGTEYFDEERWSRATHVIGKDILRFHAAIWPAMLISAGLSLPKNILVHGHITSGGQKMSKSLGNVIDPNDMVSLFREVSPYPGEVLRFVLLHEIPSFEDGDLTVDSIKQAYTSHFVKGIGNLVSRVCTMINKYEVVIDDTLSKRSEEKVEAIYAELSVYSTKLALELLMSWSRELDVRIAIEEPFKLFKTDPEKARQIVKEIHSELRSMSGVLALFMPETSIHILRYLDNPHEITPIFTPLP
jgi:methionyl-tRNA synthetase